MMAGAPLKTGPVRLLERCACGLVMSFSPGGTPVPDFGETIGTLAAIEEGEVEFDQLVAEIRTVISFVVGRPTPNFAVFAGSATTGLEAGIANLTSVGGLVVVVGHGKFARRLVEMARRLNRETVHLVPNDVPRFLADSGGVVKCQLVAAVDLDSSTGERCSPAILKSLAEKLDALLLLDCVATAGELPAAERLSADILLFGSSKGMGGPPGAYFAVLSDRALERLQPVADGTLAHDWKIQVSNLSSERASFHTTPPLLELTVLSLVWRSRIAKWQSHWYTERKFVHLAAAHFVENTIFGGPAAEVGPIQIISLPGARARGLHDVLRSHGVRVALSDRGKDPGSRIRIASYAHERVCFSKLEAVVRCSVTT